MEKAWVLPETKGACEARSKINQLPSSLLVLPCKGQHGYGIAPVVSCHLEADEPIMSSFRWLRPDWVCTLLSSESRM